MMKKLLEKQIVMNFTLKLLYGLSKLPLIRYFIPSITQLLAKLNLTLNNPKPAHELRTLANTWKELMPPDGQEYYKIDDVTDDTAFVEIHLHCPLRDTGKVDTCYKFMNYDRSLMKAIGGTLTVLDSQSNSGEKYCKLAIRKIDQDASDLIPAHKKNL